MRPLAPCKQPKVPDGLIFLHRLGKVVGSALLWRLLSAARDHPTKQDFYEKTTFFQPE